MPAVEANDDGDADFLGFAGAMVPSEAPTSSEEPLAKRQRVEPLSRREILFKAREGKARLWGHNIKQANARQHIEAFQKSQAHSVHSRVAAAKSFSLA